MRGLDYYTGTIFEVKAKIGDLGAQNTLGGGGRYDRLVSSLGGPEVPAIGFGLGVERVLLALAEPAEEFEPVLALFIAVLGDKAQAWALPVAHRLRLSGRSHRTRASYGQFEIAAQARRRPEGAPGAHRR